MAEGLKVAPRFTLPLQAATETMGILAVKRAGKSNAAVVIAEEMYAAGIPWVAIDPKGDWWGIRGRGTGPGLPVLVMGGEHGDVPLNPNVGEVVADLIVRERITCVLDVSEMTRADQRRFLTAFALRLYKTNREPLHIFCEEADEYIPQRVQGDMTKMVGAFETLVKRGGFRGIGVTLVTQRSASLNNDVLTQVGTLFVMRTPHKADRDKIKGWVEYHAAGAEVLGTLHNLHAGEAWVISPEWLGVVKQITFRRRSTFDSGSTPEVGVTRQVPKSLADVDLDAVREQMRYVIEEADLNDPKKLKDRVAELERELARLNTEYDRLMQSQPEPERIEVPTLTDEDQRSITHFVDGLDRVIKQMQEEADHIKSAVAETLRAQRKPGITKEMVQDYPTLRGQIQEEMRKSYEPVRQTAAATVIPRSSGNGGDLTGPERKILTALAQHGPKDKITLAILTGYSHKGGGFNNPLGSLRSKGYATKGNPIKATQDGIDALGDYESLPTGRDLLEWWLPQLTGPERAILKALQDLGGTATKEDLAAAAGYSPQGGGFNNPLGHMRTLGIIERGTPVSINREMM